jgi:UTP--glucose-1-phosphate uridylyltransferase
MNKRIRKAIIPAAGFGTRFLPATKAQPKEMLPIVDKPIIQYVVEDAVSAGIEDIIIVTGWSKRTIEDHFDYPFELEKRLEAAGKIEELEQIRQIADLANFYYLRQKGPLGNATAIWNAKEIIGDEPFLVLWGDDFIEASPTRCQQLVAAYEKHGGSAILSSVVKNKPDDYKRYGYVTGKDLDNGLIKIDKILEKPGYGNIQSDNAVVSGYVFEPSIFESIEKVMQRADVQNGTRENMFTDALELMLKEGKDCYALKIDGKYHDCGNKLEYLKAVVEFGLKHEDLKVEFEEYLNNLKS